MLSDSPLRGLSLLYFATSIAAMANFIAVGDGSLLRLAHVAFALSVMALTFSRGFLRETIRPIALSWHATLITLFLIYALIMAAIHWDREISASFVRTFFDRILPGFLLGFVAFGRYGKEGGWLARRRKFIDLIGLTFFFASLYYSLRTLLPLVREDIFLISSRDGDTGYQLLGIYLVLGMVVFLRITENLWSKSAVRALFISSAICAVALSCFILAQAAGSNSAALLIPTLAALTLAHQTFLSLRAGTARGLAKAAIVMTVATGSYMSLMNMVSDLPPIRLFGFMT